MFVLALLIGIVAGLRTMTAPAAVAWAAYNGWLPVQGTLLGFLGHWIAPPLLTVLAAVELVVDLLPGTPSRKAPTQFGARIVSGGVAGAALGASGDAPLMLVGLVAGVIGAVLGTLGGAAARSQIAAALGGDLPAALIEDFVAIVGAFVIVQLAR